MPIDNPWLFTGGCLSLAAALLHLAVIVGGPDWYRFFGAGERLARLAEAGSLRPALITAAIASILALWAAYAWAGAGLIPPLPLMRPALVAITAIYLLRGLVPVPALILKPGMVTPFLVWSSLIVLAYGLVHAIGLSQLLLRQD